MQLAELELCKWKTRDGQILLWRDMSTRHLRNTIAFLRRRAEEEHSAYWHTGNTLQGEAAVDAWESAETSLTARVIARQTVADLMEQYLAFREKAHA